MAFFFFSPWDEADVGRLDVYGENVRVCVPFDSLEHGRVMAICVGAMMVGSTVMTAKPGRVSRTDELGYFQFGKSLFFHTCRDASNKPRRRKHDRTPL